MKIAIVGWGVEGQSAYRYFGTEHDYLIVSEEPRNDFPPETDHLKVQSINTDRSPGITGNVAALDYLKGIEDYDKIIYTPTSVFNLQEAFGDDKGFWHKATTAQHIFFEKVKTKNIIGVTGTKGKGTTSTLIAKMLEASGKKVYLGGNIGLSVLDFVDDVRSDDWVVLELSNFQLYSLKTSPHIAVCIMITEEHLDWHTDMKQYIEAKANMFRYQKADDIAIYFSDNLYSEEIAGFSPGTKIPYFEKPGAYVRDDGMIVIGEDETEVINGRELKLLGKHNWQNTCAALTAVWQVTQNLEAIRQVLSTFTGLEHRLEFVRELDGVRYYDDSFGTTPDTAIVAMHAFVQPEVLIIGGSDKGLSFDKMVDEIASKERIRHIITIGKTGPTLAKMLRAKGITKVTEGLSTMPEIIKEARAKAQPGDVVLLSTGCASFGLFKDYKDRGNQFKEVVRALA